jgi:ADP-ribose pyrophosphatase YjhB (NUDIX family)
MFSWIVGVLASFSSWLLGEETEPQTQQTNTMPQPQPQEHIVALSNPYPGSQVTRGQVPKEKVRWTEDYPNYSPVYYEADVVKQQPVWADDPANLRSLKFNSVDGKVNRVSFHGDYEVDASTGLPKNPCGRTGVAGRGILGKFGPNHAADPIVTRWKRTPSHEIATDSKGRPLLEFVAVKRRDNGLWAIPGGMVDAGEHTSVAVKREFGEEALNALEGSAEKKEAIKQRLDDMFSPEKVTHIYDGYVDDPRNIDNAWMETTAVNVHDPDGSVFDEFELESGDDAAAAKWATYTPGMTLFASHTSFLAKTYELRAAQLRK